MKEIIIKTEYIKLDSFLKWCNECQNGGEAKFYIKEGNVKVNGEVEFQRGKKLYDGYEIEINKNKYKIKS